MGLSWYNGFSPEERMKGDKIIKQAIKDGRLLDLRLQKCAMCGQDKGVKHYHCEDYSPEHIVDDAIPLCWRCHMMLHSRFRHPKAWKIYKEEISNGKKYPPLYSCSFEELAKEHFNK